MYRLPVRVGRLVVRAEQIWSCCITILLLSVQAVGVPKYMMPWCPIAGGLGPRDLAESTLSPPPSQVPCCAAFFFLLFFWVSRVAGVVPCRASCCLVYLAACPQARSPPSPRPSLANVTCMIAPTSAPGRPRVPGHLFHWVPAMSPQPLGDVCIAASCLRPGNEK